MQCKNFYTKKIATKNDKQLNTEITNTERKKNQENEKKIDKINIFGLISILQSLLCISNSK